MENNNVLTRIYEEREVAFRENNGQNEVRIDEVARFCGWTRIANSGNEVIRWERVNGFLKDLSCPQVGTGDFIPEYIMYPLIGKANNDRATQFMLWVGKVLVEIRQNGAYVSKDITPLQEEKLDKFSTNKKIMSTFKFCNIEEIEAEFKECMIYYKNKDGKEKNAIQNTVINALNDRKQTLIDSGKGSFALVLAEVVNTISKKKTETSNKRNGQTIRYKNGIIDKQTQIINEKDEELNNLENTIAYLNPSIDEFMSFNIHPISENYMYKPINSYNGGLSMARTDTYNTWIKNFPRYKATLKEELNIEWDKPVKVFIKVDCLERFDTTNFVKAINDMIVNRIYDEDDKIAVDTQIQRNKIVDNYSQGKIYFCIRNVD